VKVATAETRDYCARRSARVVFRGCAVYCYMGFDVTGVTSQTGRIECIEGDPCDAGTCGDDKCTFQFRVCVNQAGVTGCTPPSGGFATVKTPGPFRSRIPSPLTGAVCGSPLTLDLKLKANGGRSNSRTVRPRATAPAGTTPRRDRDPFNFVCLPRTSPCASPGGAFLSDVRRVAGLSGSGLSRRGT
jgi:hypothetical protein